MIATNLFIVPCRIVTTIWRRISFLCAFLISVPFLAGGQTFVETDPGFIPLASADLCWGDYDNDGDQDLIIQGTMDDNYGPVTKLYRNDGAGAFTEIETEISHLKYGHLEWGDYDNDNDLDLLQNGRDSSDVLHTKVYRNDGGDIFTETMAALPAIYYGPANWVDYDNDGDLDVFLSGNYYSSIVSVMYRNNGNDSFTYNDCGFTGISNGDSDWGDFDNDGDLDLLLMGVDENVERFVMLYRNDGNYSFTEVSPVVGVDTLFPRLYRGAAKWGDYDSDGDLDVFLTGQNNFDQYKSYVFKNTGDGHFVDVAADLFGVYSSNSAGAWGDCDNDGDLDIAYSGEYFDSIWRDASRLYINNGDNTFSELPAGLINMEASLSWIDYDNDNDLDLFITGDLYDNGYIRYSKIYRNDVINPNSIPETPENISAVQDSVSKIIRLSWSQSSDNETNGIGLTYNITLDSVAGGTGLYSPSSDIATGYRKIIEMGNQQLDTVTEIELNYGTYYWQVQSVDNSFAGSPFSVTDTISVLPLAYFHVSDIEICNGDSVVVSFAGCASDSAQFTWDFDNATIIDSLGEQSFLLSFQTAGTKNLSLIIEDGGFTSLTNNIQIVVNSIPGIYAGLDTTLCYGESFTIDPEVENGTPPYQYLWNTGDMSDTIDISPDNDSIIIVSVIDFAGCSSNDTIIINVERPYEEQEICMVTVDSETGKNMIVWEKTQSDAIESYNLFRAVTTSNYNWIGNVPYDSLSVFVDMESDPTVHSDRYRMTVIDTCGNESSMSKHHTTVNLSVAQGAIESSIILNWNSYAIEGGEILPDMYYIYRGTTPDNLQVYDSLAEGSNTYNDNGVTSVHYYEIAVDLPYNCIVTDISTLDSIFDLSISNLKSSSFDDIEELSLFEKVNIYPNPFSDRTTIYLETKSDNNPVVNIYDLTGKLVRQIKSSTSYVNNIKTIDVIREDLNSGCYVVEIIDKEKLFRAKLIVK